jgi:DNA-binding transcriptional ArsR family regulator
MSQSRVRPVVACVLCVVLLSSLGTAAGGLGHVESAPTTTDSATDSEPTYRLGARAASGGTTPLAAGETAGFDVEAATTAGVAGTVIDPAAQSASQSPQRVGSVVSTGLDSGLAALGPIELGHGDASPRLEPPTSTPTHDSPLGPTGLVALAGYSRYDDSDPLDHTLRARIYDAVQESPGVYPAALETGLDASRSTLRHHLRVLVEEGLVAERDADGRRRYVAVEATAAERALATVDDGSTAAEIVEQLATDGSATVSDLATRLDCSPGTVSYHLDRLEDAAVVERERDGQAVTNRLRPAVEPAVTQPAAATTDPESVAGVGDD